MTRSTWKLTWDPDGTPIVVLDYGQALDDELGFPWAQRVQTSGGLRAPGLRNHARGHVTNGLTLTTWKDHDDLIAAAEWCLDFQIALNGRVLESHPLVLEIQGGTKIYEMDHCVIAAAPTKRLMQGVPRTETRWSLVGDPWTDVTPEPEP